jgi:hypothetical protein
MLVKATFRSGPRPVESDSAPVVSTFTHLLSAEMLWSVSKAWASQAGKSGTAAHHPTSSFVRVIMGVGFGAPAGLGARDEPSGADTSRDPCGDRPLSADFSHSHDDDRAGSANDQEMPPVHSMTSSAPASNVCGTVRPSSLAVLRLMTSSNVVGCWTGRSAGLAPLRILPA